MPTSISVWPFQGHSFHTWNPPEPIFWRKKTYITHEVVYGDITYRLASVRDYLWRCYEHSELWCKYINYNFPSVRR